MICITLGCDRKPDDAQITVVAERLCAMFELGWVARSEQTARLRRR
jgi:hypothetical protein